jgi:flagellar L-ring protein precursor FlgH
LLAGCGSLQRLSEVGRPPSMTPIGRSDRRSPATGPLSLPMPTPHAPGAARRSALWRNGSRAFFKDQRAANVGDLITVLVNITDSADFENETDGAAATARRGSACRASSASRRRSRT